MDTSPDRQNGHGKPGRPSIPPDDLRCTAKSKQRQDRCKNYRLPGFTVCRYHGGKTPVGIESPSWRHGRYSRIIPKRVSARFEALVTDPDTLNLARDLALLDVRIEELLGRLDDGESENGWRQAQDGFAKLRTAMTAGNGQEIRQQIQALARIFQAATAADATWRDVRDALQERRLIVESERRRLVDLHQMVTVEQLMVFANALVGIVNEEEPDPRVRTAIALKVRGLLGRSGRPATHAPAAIEGRSRPIVGNGHGS